jgi:hypothetical protein
VFDYNIGAIIFVAISLEDCGETIEFVMLPLTEDFAE